MTKQIPVETQEFIAATLFNRNEQEADLKDDATESVAYEQVGLGAFWGTEAMPGEPVIFVGFPKNFKSRGDMAYPVPVQADMNMSVRYEEPLGEAVPYEEMGLSRFL